MPKEKRPVEYPSLLSEGQRVRLTVRRVSEQIPRRSGEPERADVRACFVACVVLGFALCEPDVPRSWQRVVPLVRGCYAARWDSKTDYKGYSPYALNQTSRT